MGLPAGFELETQNPQATPPLPAGFELEEQPIGGWRGAFSKALDLSDKAQRFTHLNPISDLHKLLSGDAPIPGGWGSGLPHLAYEAGGKVTDVASNLGASPETAAKFGYGANVATQAIPAILGSYGAAKAGQPMMQDAGRSLMQSAMKPNVAALQKGQAERAVETALQEGINPTAGGMEKLDKLSGGLNTQVENAIANSSARVPVGDVSAHIAAPYNKFAQQVNPAADTNAIKDVLAQFKAHPDIAGQSDMPVQLAHALKKGTYRAIGEKAYGEVSTAATEAQKALAAGMRAGVAKGVPETVEPLKREADLMNLLSVAEKRALMDSNKNPISLGASIAAVARDPLAGAGLWLNSSTPAKAYLARLLYSGSHRIPQAAGGLAGAAMMAPSGQAPSEQEMLAQQLRGR